MIRGRAAPLSRRTGPRRRLGALAPCALAALAASVPSGCGRTAQTFEASWDVAGGDFDAEQRVALTTARARLALGDLEAARRELARHVAADPSNIELAAWFQDVEIAILEAAANGEPPRDEELAQLAENPAPIDALRERYARRAAETPTVAGWVLAARVARDPVAAEAMLADALALDPQNAWAWYATAHVLIRQSQRTDRWSLARSALDRALASEPGFLRARRLRAWMLAEEGQRGPALEALDAWLVAAEDDPRVPDAARVEARLDRALLLLLDGRGERARRELADLEGEDTGRARRLALLVVAELESGDVQRAVRAAMRAEGASRGNVLALVQQALLHERFLDDPQRAEELWRRVVEQGTGSSDIGEMIQTLRARVTLERRAAAEGGAAEATGRAGTGNVR